MLAWLQLIRSAAVAISHHLWKALRGPGHSVAERCAPAAALQREQDAVPVSPSQQTRVLPLPLGGVSGKRSPIDFGSSAGISCCGTGDGVTVSSSSSMHAGG